MQYNYSYNNEGAGYLFAQFSGATAFTDNVARYNISESDGRRNSYGAVHLWSSGTGGGIQRTDIYGNTVYLAPSGSGSPKALIFHSGGSTIRNTRVFNNIFVTTGGLELFRATSIPNSTSIFGNLYWSNGAAFNLRWGGTMYTSLAAWRSASGLETFAGAPTGVQADPLLKNPGGEVALTDPALLVTLTGYEINVGSPALNAGIDLASKGISGGSRDYFGNGLPTGVFDIGAHERSSVDPLNYAEWQYAVHWPSAADATPAGDPDGDGDSNLLEFGLDSDPLDGKRANQPKISVTSVGSDNWATLQFRRNKVATDLTRTVWSSPSLLTWEPIVVDGVGAIESIVDPDPDGDGSAELVEIKTRIPSDQPRFFLRLEVGQR